MMYKQFLFFILLMTITNCHTQKSTSMPQKKHAFTNDLIHESSPYLLQHAHNPVQWHPWGKSAIDVAKKSNKLLIISIGYAACHWCHVMEHESFEDTITAKLMNDHYVSIKVDREEHPDVDKIYMSAVQQLTGRGGWPLNVIALPDGRPVWGGTYFPNDKWKSALYQIADLWQKNPKKLYDVADQLEKGIKAAEIIHPNTSGEKFDKESIKKALSFWKQYKDDTYGGFNRAPKFPMPAQYQFLLRAGLQLQDKDIQKFVKLTLDKMLQGGIYDHINGGFARYATDTKWHIPHFEKMLYDNAQLVSLYSQAYLLYKEDAYKQGVYETLSFVQNELMDDTGAFYSSLDADSLDENGELEEGAYYVFTKKELKELIGEDFPLFKEYFNINAYGLWEEGKYHLIKKMNDDAFVKAYNISKEDLLDKVLQWKEILRKYREHRERPRLDDKTLTSWNALMLNGFVDAYKTFQNPEFIEVALKNARFIKQHQIKKDFSLWHSYKNNKSTIDAYLEDYALLIKAYINLYEVTGDTQWLFLSDELLQYAIQHFYDQSSGMFYFTANDKNDLLTRPMETDDNVIPSSNAVMADNLFRLGHFFEKQDYIDKSTIMLQNILPKIGRYAPGYYQWLNDILDHIGDFYELAIVGVDAKNEALKLYKYYIPNKIIAFADKENDLALLQNRMVPGKTYIYLCVNNACQLPETKIQEVIKKIKIKL